MDYKAYTWSIYIDHIIEKYSYTYTKVLMILINMLLASYLFCSHEVEIYNTVNITDYRCIYSVIFNPCMMINIFENFEH